MAAQSQQLIAQAAGSTVSGLFRDRARTQPNVIAVQDETHQYSYGELEQRVNRLANSFLARGLQKGSRVAVLSENRIEYLEVFLAAARCGCIAACQNWRLAPAELHHCLTLAEPQLLLLSGRHRQALLAADVELPVIEFGEPYEAMLAAADNAPPAERATPDDPLLLLYTSGTTGLPKGALISHRAEIARNLVVCAEFGITSSDTFVAWSPLYHMGAADFAIGTLINGAAVVVVDGFDAVRLATLATEQKLGWLMVMPGMVEQFCDAFESRGQAPVGIKLCGVMADLVPPRVIARVTRLLGAPYANTFGATETGCPPASSSRIPVGVVPTSLSKTQSPFCEVRLVDADDNDVANGTPGELAMRGPTLFSGYWRNEETNSEDFRGGWFHMGDIFVRNDDGSLDFVDRVKYLIKSGGENIYPAEIERVLMAEAGVVDVAVVRRSDKKWGEVPVAFVALNDGCGPTEQIAARLYARCRELLAGYKQPAEIRFIQADEFPRSVSGKIQRHELEKQL